MCPTHSDLSPLNQDQALNPNNTDLLDNDFWQFSLSLYANPEVANFCLRLQDQHNMQVNLLLYSIWLSFERCILEPQLIKQNSQLQNWLSQVIPAIRKARRAVGENSKQAPLYKQLKACELDAEQKAQAILFDIERLPAQRQDTDNSAEQDSFESRFKTNLALCWHAFSDSSEENSPPELINEFSQWMIVHCQRKIDDKLKY